MSLHPLKHIFPVCSLLLCLSCRSQTPAAFPITQVVGELLPIPGDSFGICGDQNRIVQYYAFGEKPYAGEKRALTDIFEAQYQAVDGNDESGLIRIRFVVNCQGKAGRFHLMGMNPEYQAHTFSPEITEQLLRITQNLEGWKRMQANGQAFDYYQYLIFKIEQGNLIEIMP